MKLNQTVLSIFVPKSKSSPQSASANTKAFEGQQIARLYCIYAVFLFSVQGIVAILGALDLVMPSLPSPIPYEYGRAIHLSFAITWPFIGTMGLAYFFTIEELKAEIYSSRAARWQFWLSVFSTLGLFSTLALRIGRGREYLDGLPIFYIGISLSVALGVYNLARTLRSNKDKLTPSAGIVTAGMIFLLILLIPNIIRYRNPVADQAVKFWVVHLWEEMAFELTTAGFIASFFAASGLAARKQIERWLYLEASLSVSGGLFGTGHHYYWIGYPAVWLIIGVLFSLIQVIPVAFLVHMTYKGLKNKRPLVKREKITLVLLLSSMFYHVLGAALFGLIITVPWINLYIHGTYITSAHSHLALFGTMGFLVISGCYYVLSKGIEPKRKSFFWSIGGILLINAGLILMSSALLIAGFLQVYLWRYLGKEFIEAQAQVKPYLFWRVLGGMIFTTGVFLLNWQIFKVWWTTRKRKFNLKIFGKN